MCTRYFQGTFEKCCIGQDKVEGQPEEVTQEACQAPRAPPQACEGHREEEQGSLLHPPLLQIRHFDYDSVFLIPSNRFKAVIYCNAVLVQEMYDISVMELRKRLRQRLIELDATSSSPLTKAVR